MARSKKKKGRMLTHYVDNKRGERAPGGAGPHPPKSIPGPPKGKPLRHMKD